MARILSSLIKILSTIFIILLLCYLFVSARDVGKEIFANQAKDPAGSIRCVESVVTIHDGDSLLTISKKLEEKGIVGNAYLFALTLRFSEEYNSIQPGDYEVNSGMKPSELLDVFSHKGEPSP